MKGFTRYTINGILSIKKIKRKKKKKRWDRDNQSDHCGWTKLNRQYKMKLMDWFTKSWVVTNEHIGVMTQCDLIVAPQVSEEWTSSTRVWWMQMDWDTDHSNTSYNKNFQQRVTPVEVFEQQEVLEVLRVNILQWWWKLVLTTVIQSTMQRSVTLTWWHVPRSIGQMNELFEIIQVRWNKREN